MPKTKDWPSIYSCKFLEAGIVSYKDSAGGIALISKETIDAMLPTFIGKPVIIQHQDATPENFSKLAVGYVTGCRFCPEDGWFYADFILIDDEAKKCVDQAGYSVSCAYNVLDTADGGLWHDIEYDGEITEGSFTHLALVEQPRYEGSKITKQLPAMLINGKVAIYQNMKQEESEMFKIFKKENEKKEDFSNLHVAVNGKDVPLTELIASYVQNNKNDKKDPEKSELTFAKDDDVVDVNGEKVSVKDLKNSYMKANDKNGANTDPGKEEAGQKGNKVEAKENTGKDTKDNTQSEDEMKEFARGVVKDKPGNIAETVDDSVVIKKNEKDDDDKDNKENSKKKSNEYFVELQNAGKQYNDDDTGPATTMGKTRQERASERHAKLSGNKSK